MGGARRTTPRTPASLGHRTASTAAERRELGVALRDDAGRPRPRGRAGRARAGRPRSVTPRPCGDAPHTIPTRRCAAARPSSRPRSARRSPARTLLALLADDDAWVAEAAAFALGEHPRRGRHASPRSRARRRDATTIRWCARPRSPRSARSGDPSTLPRVLAACDDKPAIRRRAVLALAAFEGPRSRRVCAPRSTDPDWQVRQAAEDLLGDHATT